MLSSFPIRSTPLSPAQKAVSRTLNYALSDFGIAQAAKVLGHMDDYNTLMARAVKAYQRKEEGKTR